MVVSLPVTCIRVRINNAIPENFLTCHRGYVFPNRPVSLGCYADCRSAAADSFISTEPLRVCTSQIETIHVRRSEREQMHGMGMARPPVARARALLHRTTGRLPILAYPMEQRKAASSLYCTRHCRHFPVIHLIW